MVKIVYENMFGNGNDSGPCNYNNAIYWELLCSYIVFKSHINSDCEVNPGGKQIRMNVAEVIFGWYDLCSIFKSKPQQSLEYNSNCNMVIRQTFCDAF